MLVACYGMESVTVSDKMGMEKWLDFLGHFAGLSRREYYSKWELKFVLSGEINVVRYAAGES